MSIAATEVYTNSFIEDACLYLPPELPPMFNVFPPEESPKLSIPIDKRPFSKPREIRLPPELIQRYDENWFLTVPPGVSGFLLKRLPKVPDNPLRDELPPYYPILPLIPGVVYMIPEKSIQQKNKPPYYFLPFKRFNPQLGNYTYPNNIVLTAFSFPDPESAANPDPKIVSKIVYNLNSCALPWSLFFGDVLEPKYYSLKYSLYLLFYLLSRPSYSGFSNYPLLQGCSPFVEIPITHKQLAMLLGYTRPSVSDLLRRKGELPGITTNPNKHGIFTVNRVELIEYLKLGI